MGGKPDMKISSSTADRPLESGGAEDASDINDEDKYQHESRLKLPKLLKDIAYNLGSYSNWDKSKTDNMEVVGFIQSGHAVGFLTMTMSSYPRFLNRSPRYEVAGDAARFSKALQVLVMATKTSLRVAKTIDVALDSELSFGDDVHNNPSLCIVLNAHPLILLLQ